MLITLENGRLESPDDSLMVARGTDFFLRQGKGGYEGLLTLNVFAPGVNRPQAVSNADYKLVACYKPTTAQWFAITVKGTIGKKSFLRMRTLEEEEVS